MKETSEASWWFQMPRRLGLLVVLVLIAPLHESLAQTDRAGGASRCVGKVPQELRRLLSSGSLDGAVEFVKGLAFDDPDTVACAGAALRADAKYQTRVRARRLGELTALEAANKSQIDIARFKLAAADGITVLAEESRQAEIEAALAAIRVMDPPPLPSSARSRVVDLAGFLARWRGIVGGEHELAPELASEALDIRGENVCEDGGNAFERAECEAFQKQLRAFILEGLRRRLLILHGPIWADYDIAKKRWTVEVPTTIRRDMGVGALPFFKAAPRKCAWLDNCVNLCGEGDGGEQFFVPMAPEDARPIVDRFAGQLSATIAFRLGAEGRATLPGCSTPDPVVMRYSLYSVAGVRVLGAEGDVLFAKGLFR